MIEEIALEPKQTFWIMTVNLLGDTAAVEWCKVFGSWEEDTHWAQVVPRDRHDEIRADLLNAINISKDEWEQYWKSIVGYRNQMVSHHDLDTKITNYPHYDVAILAANFMFDRLREFADPGSLGGIPTSLDRWSKTVSGNMSAIVRKAFEASATLGSNIPSSTA